jgi:hypothetical protein
MPRSRLVEPRNDRRAARKRCGRAAGLVRPAHFATKLTGACATQESTASEAPSPTTTPAAARRFNAERPALEALTAALAAGDVGLSERGTWSRRCLPATNEAQETQPSLDVFGPCEQTASECRWIAREFPTNCSRAPTYSGEIAERAVFASRRVDLQCTQRSRGGHGVACAVGPEPFGH